MDRGLDVGPMVFGEECACLLDRDETRARDAKERERSDVDGPRETLREALEQEVLPPTSQLAAVVFARANSASLISLNFSKGCAPEIMRPLMKNAGVPLTPTSEPAAMSASI